MQGRSCTQGDIAKALGVSQAAVCLAVGNARSARRKRLSNALCQKIRAKALEMGYKTQRTQHVVRTGRTTSITILNFGGYSEISARRTYTVGRMANEAGFNFNVVDAYWHHDDLDRVIEGILNTHPLAVIVAGAMQPGFSAETLVQAGIHVVGIGVPVPGCPWVRYDARGAIRTITEKMIAAGRRRLALLVRNYENIAPSWQFEERRQGFLDAVTAAGAQMREYDAHGTDFGFSARSSTLEAMVATESHASVDIFRDFDGAGALAKHLETTSVPPDMLVCTNDSYAISAMSACSRRGLRIPEDVAISGFDNMAISTKVLVPLTTVEHPNTALCKAAIEIIQEKQRHPAAMLSREEVKVFPCRIVWRESTGGGGEERDET